MANQQTRELRKLSAKKPGVHHQNFACIVTSSSCGTRHDVRIVNMSHGSRAFKFIGDPDKATFQKLKKPYRR